MTRLRAMLTLAAASALTGGCVAAAIPVVAGGALAREQVRKSRAAKAQKAAAEQAEVRPLLPETMATIRAAQETAAAQRAAGGTGSAGTAVARPGEDAAYTIQAYQALWTYLSARVRQSKSGATMFSVVLADTATLDAPSFVPCTGKPLAILFDLDTARGVPPVARLVAEGRALTAVPGAIEGIEAARREAVAVIFTAEGVASDAAPLAAALGRAGISGRGPGTTLFLHDPAGGVAEADRVRRQVAETYCVVALVGDALDEFSRLFDPAGDEARRRTAATETMVAPLWGAGWFLLPTPVRVAALPTQDMPKE